MALSVLNPPRFFACTIKSMTSAGGWPSGPLAGTPYKWNAVLTVTAMTHSHPSAGVTQSYNGKHVKVGDWVATTAMGRALTVSSISAATNGEVTCVLEDEALFNAVQDPEGNREGRIPFGAGNKGYIFGVENNFPAMLPLPTLMASAFPAHFAAQMLSRFFYVKGAPNRVRSNTFHLGDQSSDGNKVLYFDDGSDANLGGIRLNVTTKKIEYSHGGDIWDALGDVQDSITIGGSGNKTIYFGSGPNAPAISYDIATGDFGYSLDGTNYTSFSTAKRLVDGNCRFEKRDSVWKYSVDGGVTWLALGASNKISAGNVIVNVNETTGNLEISRDGGATYTTIGETATSLSSGHGRLRWNPAGHWESSADDGATWTEIGAGGGGGSTNTTTLFGSGFPVLMQRVPTASWSGPVPTTETTVITVPTGNPDLRYVITSIGLTNTGTVDINLTAGINYLGTGNISLGNAMAFPAGCCTDMVWQAKVMKPGDTLTLQASAAGLQAYVSYTVVPAGADLFGGGVDLTTVNQTTFATFSSAVLLTSILAVTDGAADADVSVLILDSANAVRGYVCSGTPLRGAPPSTLECLLNPRYIPAGYKLAAKASAANLVEVHYTAASAPGLV